ncbi:MAG: cupin domain-containing protein [Immundisolibacter sp.]|uniref:cupin domain-containing protein n=1 Tax=Immundisolibacter sp. TaxID=1934948 RepID=UPI001999C0B7|nr:cupin domain-containing protein [Immundisolibacter sp.]MBC7161749.1 cupin domain-containing protein [Immundisolibacter sp.]
MKPMPGMLTPETLPSGTLDPLQFAKYSQEKANVVPVYADGEDLGIVSWNLLPGQANESHSHPYSAHCFLIVEGEGHYLKGQPGSADYAEYPIKAGQTVVIPRNQVHGIRNTGKSPLSYFAITTTAGGEYARVVDGVVHKY